MPKMSILAWQCAIQNKDVYTKKLPTDIHAMTDLPAQSEICVTTEYARQVFQKIAHTSMETAQSEHAQTRQVSV